MNCVVQLARLYESTVQPTIKLGAVSNPEERIGMLMAGGTPLEADDVVASKTVTGPNGRPYYVYDLKVGGKENVLVSASVYNDRAYLAVLKANSLQWRKSKEALREIR